MRFQKGVSGNPGGLSKLKGYATLEKRYEHWESKSLNELMELATDSKRFGSLNPRDAGIIRHLIAIHDGGGMADIGKERERYYDRRFGPVTNQVIVVPNENSDPGIDQKHKEFLGQLYNRFTERLATITPEPLSNGHAKNGHTANGHAPALTAAAILHAKPNGHG